MSQAVAEAMHPVAEVVHPMAVVAEGLHLAVVAVAEETHNLLPQESMQRNPTWVASWMDTAEKKPGLVENHTSNGQDWRHPMQSTFHNHPKCNQAAQKLLPVT